jgi:threonine dehydrogenase-like Zn-dependent dehydrogenase
MELVRNKRVDLRVLLTHAFPLDDIVKAYKFFEQRSDGVVKVAIKP